MAVQYSGKLVGTNSTEMTHGPSGSVIKTTAPVDNGGDGSTFSPTDLCAASLGACATTIMGMYIAKNNIPVEGIRFELEKEMSTNAPRRIAKLTVHFHIKTKCSEEDFKRIVNAGKTCPVGHSLSKDVEVVEHYLRE
ncbi:MAG: OsmC family protein [Bdellovibrionota bacterium]